jgi:deoxyribonuclease-1
MHFLLVLIVFLPLLAYADKPTDSIKTFSSAKVAARDEVYFADPAFPVTFYCRCYFTQKGKSGGVVDPGDCGFTTTGSQKRGRTLEWEHVMPANIIAGKRACWTKDGFGGKCMTASGNIIKNRSCCEKAGVDVEARHAINDLHNLVPSVGTLNASRSNHPYGLIEGEDRRFGECDFETGGSPKRAEPAKGLRGNVARIWLYMNETWEVGLDAKTIQLMEQWSADDPPSAWEKERDRRIEKVQGNRNPFVRPD